MLQMNKKVIYSFRDDLLKEDFDIKSKIDENRIDYVQKPLISCKYFPRNE